MSPPRTVQTSVVNIAKYCVISAMVLVIMIWLHQHVLRDVLEQGPYSWRVLLLVVATLGRVDARAHAQDAPYSWLCIFGGHAGSTAFMEAVGDHPHVRQPGGFGPPIRRGALWHAEGAPPWGEMVRYHTPGWRGGWVSTEGLPYNYSHSIEPVERFRMSGMEATSPSPHTLPPLASALGALQHSESLRRPPGHQLHECALRGRAPRQQARQARVSWLQDAHRPDRRAAAAVGGAGAAAPHARHRVPGGLAVRQRVPLAQRARAHTPSLSSQDINTLRNALSAEVNVRSLVSLCERNLTRWEAQRNQRGRAEAGCVDGRLGKGALPGPSRMQFKFLNGDVTAADLASVHPACSSPRLPAHAHTLQTLTPPVSRASRAAWPHRCCRCQSTSAPRGRTTQSCRRSRRRAARTPSAMSRTRCARQARCR